MGDNDKLTDAFSWVDKIERERDEAVALLEQRPDRCDDNRDEDWEHAVCEFISRIQAAGGGDGDQNSMD